MGRRRAADHELARRCFGAAALARSDAYHRPLARVETTATAASWLVLVVAALLPIGPAGVATAGPVSFAAVLAPAIRLGLFVGLVRLPGQIAASAWRELCHEQRAGPPFAAPGAPFEPVDPPGRPASNGAAPASVGVVAALVADCVVRSVGWSVAVALSAAAAALLGRTSLPATVATVASAAALAPVAMVGGRRAASAWWGRLQRPAPVTDPTVLAMLADHERRARARSSAVERVAGAAVAISWWRVAAGGVGGPASTVHLGRRRAALWLDARVLDAAATGDDAVLRLLVGHELAHAVVPPRGAPQSAAFAAVSTGAAAAVLHCWAPNRVGSGAVASVLALLTVLMLVGSGVQRRHELAADAFGALLAEDSQRSRQSRQSRESREDRQRGERTAALRAVVLDAGVDLQPGLLRRAVATHPSPVRRLRALVGEDRVTRPAP